MSLFASAALGQGVFRLEAPGAEDELIDMLRATSLTQTAQEVDAAPAQDIFAAARADYARLLGTLYSEGFYSSAINILIDGREAAAIPLLEAPSVIGEVLIRVTPGPRFQFARTAVGPLAPGTELPERFAPGRIARSTAVVAAADAGVLGWREAGHAKVDIARQQVTARHAQAELDVDIGFAPGPRVTFGELTLRGYERTNPRRLAKIAGFPTGEVFHPDDLERVRNRVNRTGVFSAVTLTEAERLGPGDTLDVDLAVVEAPRRRMGAGIEIGSVEGLALTGFWLHRNLLGGAERLRVDAGIIGIGGDTGGTDYRLGVRVDRPATITADTSAYVLAEVFRLHEEDHRERGVVLGFGLTHFFSDNFSAEAGIAYSFSEVTDDFGTTRYRAVSLPLRGLWDNRDVPTNATEGYYLDARATPFYGFGDTGSGAQFTVDARAYYQPPITDRLVLAGRAQAGTITGAEIGEIPRSYLFYSGGGGTVRGQPYQSLGVNVLEGGALRTGGMSFAALSAEARVQVRGAIGLVAFYDAGYVMPDSGFGGDGDWHGGAGIGVRYDTGIGPIRFDVAGPAGGNTGDGVQFYIGIGQAF